VEEHTQKNDGVNWELVATQAREENDTLKQEIDSLKKQMESIVDQDERLKADHDAAVDERNRHLKALDERGQRIATLEEHVANLQREKRELKDRTGYLTKELETSRAKGVETGVQAEERARSIQDIKDVVKILGSHHGKDL